MFIIIEGIDCAGKSWASEYLCKKISNSFYIKHCNTPKTGNASEISLLKTSYETILNFYRSYVQPNHGHLVVDRYYPSELVYSSVMRQYDAFLDEYYNDLEKIVMKLEYRLLYIHAPMEEVIKRIELRGDSYVEIEHLSRLKHRYNKFLEHTKLKNIRTILSGSEDLDEFLKEKRL
jgi:thymidylate kinase